MKRNGRRAERDIARCAECVEAYCRVIERHRRTPQEQFLRQVLRTLSNLFAAANHLPKGDSDEELHEKELTHDEWMRIFRSLRKKVGRHDPYWTMFSPYADEDRLEGSLADDLADIYRDTKPGLVAYRKGKSPLAVAWNWKINFIDHWGRHAASALRALQDRHSDWWLGE